MSTMMTDFGEQIPVPESLYNVICDAVQQSDHETINQTLYRFDEKLRYRILTCFKSKQNLLYKAHDGPIITQLLNSIPESKRLNALLAPHAVISTVVPALFPKYFHAFSTSHGDEREVAMKIQITQSIIDTLNQQDKYRLLLHQSQFTTVIEQYGKSKTLTLHFIQHLTDITLKCSSDTYLCNLCDIISSIDPELLIDICGTMVGDTNNIPLIHALFAEEYEMKHHRIQQLLVTLMQRLPYTNKLRLLGIKNSHRQSLYCLLLYTLKYIPPVRSPMTDAIRCYRILNNYSQRLDTFQETCYGVIFPELKVADHIDFLNTVDNFGKLALHYVEHVGTLHDILNLRASQKELLDLLIAQDSHTGATILHICKYNQPDTTQSLMSILAGLEDHFVQDESHLNSIIQRLHPDDLPHLFAIQDYEGVTLLTKIANTSHKIFLSLMCAIPSHKRFEVVAAQQNYPMLPHIDCVLESLNEAERIQVMTANDSLGNTYLHERLIDSVVRNVSVPLDTFISILHTQNIHGSTPLHKHQEYRNDRVIPILKALDSTCTAEILMIRDAAGNTLLHKMAPEEVITVLENLKMNSVDRSIGLQNQQGQTVLHQMVEIIHHNHINLDIDERHNTNSSLLVAKALVFVDQSRRVDIIKLRDIGGDTILHKIDYRSPEALISVLGCVPDEEKGNILMITDRKGRTPIHHIVSMAYHNTLLQVMQQVPVTQRFHLVSIQDNAGSTPLHMAVQCRNISMSCRVILEQLTQTELLNLLAIRNKQGDSPIHLAAAYDNTYTLHILTTQTSLLNILKMLFTDEDCEELERALTCVDDNVKESALNNLDFYNRCLLLDVLTNNDEVFVENVICMLYEREVGKLSSMITESSLSKLRSGRDDT